MKLFTARISSVTFPIRRNLIYSTLALQIHHMAKKYNTDGWSKDKIAQAQEFERQIKYYDQLQYIFKIKLNSLYGALLNKHFRFYDDRLGESTTGTGRAILKFQCSKVNELLAGEYNDLGDAILYGDTDSSYFACLHNIDYKGMSYDEQLELAISRADRISDQVNEAYPEFMEDAFLCSPEFKGMVKCAREVVAPRGIFVTPKRYVLWLADKDGKRVDELKVMGLDTKKTILPKYIQDALNGFVERYLKGEEWDVLAEDIVAFKNEILTQSVIKLGLPKGVNKLELYQSALDLDPNTRVPGHVRAAILYNKMLEDNGDRQSMQITSGMKIKVFYLRQPIGKFKSIAFPVDEERVPDWFMQLNIDKELQVQKLVDNPLLNILKAIGKEAPTQQTLFVSSVLEF